MPLTIESIDVATLVREVLAELEPLVARSTPHGEHRPWSRTCRVVEGDRAQGGSRSW